MKNHQPSPKAPAPRMGSKRGLAPRALLEDGVRPTGTLLVFDAEGLNTGAGIAELLAQNGAQVHFATSLARPAERDAPKRRR